MYELIFLPILLGGAAMLAHVHQRPPERLSFVPKAELKNAQQAPGERAFIEGAANGGIYGLLLGALGFEKGQSRQLRAVSEALIRETQALNIALNAIIESKNIRIEKALGLEHRAILQQLTQLSGPEFENRFLDYALTRYGEAIRIFGEEAQEGKDKELRKLASDTVPVLKAHMKLCRNAASRAGARIFRNDSDLQKSA